MKKKLSILIALVMAILLCLSPAVATSAASMPTIDGVLDEGEWGEPTFQTDYFDVYVLDDYEYLYVAFETREGTYTPDTHDRNGMINVYTMNPNTWECWAYCWHFRDSDLIGLKYTYPPDPTVELPTEAVFAVTETVFELQIPLSELESINLGDTINFNFLSYAEEWTDWNTCWLFDQEYTLVQPPAPERALDAFDVFVKFGYDSTRYFPDNTLVGSIEVAGTYNGAQYMLMIPAGCEIEGVTGRINWLWMSDFDGDVLSFVGGDATFSEPCTLYIAEGGRLYQDYWTGEWLGGIWVEVGSFTSIVDGEAVLD